MRQYIAAVVASAGLMLGTVSVFASDPNDVNQTTPSQDQPGRQLDRSQTPATTDTSPNGNSALPAQGQQGRQVDRDQATTTTDATQTGVAPAVPGSDQPGRAFDRARLANSADSYATSDGADNENESADMIKSKASDPSSFIKAAFEGDQAVIRLGQLAEEKSSNAQVKMMAQKLVQDHQAHSDKIQQLAQQKNIQLSNQLSPKCQKKVDELSAMNGASFDKHYVHDMVRDHKKDIALYEQAANNNTDPDVKALAQSTLPTLKEHLQMAQRDATMINEPAGANTPGPSNAGQNSSASESQK